MLKLNSELHGQYCANNAKGRNVLCILFEISICYQISMYINEMDKQYNYSFRLPAERFYHFDILVM